MEKTSILKVKVHRYSLCSFSSNTRSNLFFSMHACMCVCERVRRNALTRSTRATCHCWRWMRESRDKRVGSGRENVEKLLTCDVEVLLYLHRELDGKGKFHCDLGIFVEGNLSLDTDLGKWIVNYFFVFSRSLVET